MVFREFQLTPCPLILIWFDDQVGDKILRVGLETGGVLE